MTNLYDKSEEENIVINPNTSGYVDREMAKWQGLILSEHTEVVHEEKRQSRKVNREKEKQSLEAISELIDYSYRQKIPVAIQLDCLFDGKYEDDIIGVVCGYIEQHVYVQTIESEVIVCEFDLIRNVEEVKQTKWFSV